MSAYSFTRGHSLPTIDKRVWPMMMAIGLFGVLIVKEISLPQPVILGFGIAGLLGLFMTGLQSPEVPFYVLVAYIPFSRILVGDFGTQAYALNMTNILTIWVFAGYLMKRASQGKPIFQGTAFNRAVSLFALMGGLSLVIAGFSYGSWYLWEFITPLKRWLTPMGFYFLTLWVVRDKPVYKTVAVLIMVALTMVALMAIRDYMYVNDSSFEDSRVGGICEHSNTLGAFFVYYMFLFVGFFLVYPKRLKTWLLLIPFLLCFRGIMVTFSRGAYLAFAVGALGACFFRSKGLFVAALASLMIALANPILLPSGIRYRMGQTIAGATPAYLEAAPMTEGLEASSATRLKIWQGAINMIKDHPLWGVGYGAFPHVLPRYTEDAVGEMDAHNSYLLIAGEMGIPTLLVFLLVLAMIMYYTRWLYRNTDDLTLKSVALGFLAGLCGLLVANMFGSRMDSQEASGYFWILCGLIMRGVLMERARLKSMGQGAKAVRVLG